VVTGTVLVGVSVGAPVMLLVATGLKGCAGWVLDVVGVIVVVVGVGTGADVVVFKVLVVVAEEFVVGTIGVTESQWKESAEKR